jgi:hypothetical protein
VIGVNHFPVITALDVDGADGLAMLRETVEELGGLEALRPDGPSRPEAEPFTKARLRPPPRPQADPPRPLRGAARGR